MSEMIERVALAICGSPDDETNILEIHRHRARLAMEALREPTEAMCDAVAIADPQSIRELWQAMIDEAAGVSITRLPALSVTNGDG